MTPAGPHSEITAVLPVESRFVNIARVMAASLATDLEFSIDDVDEVRLAANELVSSVIDWGVDHGATAIRLQFRVGDEGLHLSVDAVYEGEPAETGATPVDELARRILESVSDGFELDGGHGWIRKRKSPT